jgi:hypothetical protein
MGTSKQTGNIAGRDVVGGDSIVNTTAPRRTPITKLNERYLAETGEAEGLDAFVAKLQHYWDRATNDDIRRLSQKLSDSGRGDMLQTGEELKECATKIILRFQTSRTAQDILAWVLAELYGRFLLDVWPSIQADAPREVVDRLMSEKVIGTTLLDLEDNALDLSRPDLLGLVYFLAGNCYIRWDKQC